MYSIELWRRQAISTEDEDFHIGMSCLLPSVHRHFDQHSSERMLPL